MITLYTCGQTPYSHTTRIVLAEKELPVEYIEVDPTDMPPKLLELNPYGKLPTMLDRETVLFESVVVNEYLDERYPHPPLKPGSPAERAQMRLYVMRAHEELYALFHNLPEGGDEAKANIEKYLEGLDLYLARQKFMIGETYTLADVTVAPILFRLKSLGIDTAEWENLEDYMDRMFERPAFERSLSEHEQMLYAE